MIKPTDVSHKKPIKSHTLINDERFKKTFELIEGNQYTRYCEVSRNGNCFYTSVIVCLLYDDDIGLSKDFKALIVKSGVEEYVFEDFYDDFVAFLRERKIIRESGELVNEQVSEKGVDEQISEKRVDEQVSKNKVEEQVNEKGVDEQVGEKGMEDKTYDEDKQERDKDGKSCKGDKKGEDEDKNGKRSTDYPKSDKRQNKSELVDEEGVNVAKEELKDGDTDQEKKENAGDVETGHLEERNVFNEDKMQNEITTSDSLIGVNLQINSGNGVSTTIVMSDWSASTKSVNTDTITPQAHNSNNEIKDQRIHIYQCSSADYFVDESVEIRDKDSMFEMVDLNSLTMFLKLLVSTEMKLNEDFYAPFLSKSVSAYVSESVEPFYKDTDYVDILAFSRMLGIKVLVYTIEGHCNEIGTGSVELGILHTFDHFEPLLK